MTVRSGILVVLVLFSCFGNPAAGADSDTVRIDGPGTYRLLGRTHDGKALSIIVRVSGIPSGWYIGSGREHAKTLVTDLKIEREKKPLFVGFSAYADLLDPHKASLQVGSKSTRLVIIGGDTSESYSVVMLVGGQLVSSREMYSLGGAPVQRTIYWLRELKDE